ncbi:MAG: PAS domain S-box protein [Mariprofundales bacterium]
MNNKYLQSPWQLFATILLIIFVAELIVMLVLFMLHPSEKYSSLLDALLLTIIVAPILYRFVFLPLRIQQISIAQNASRLHAITSHIPDGLITINELGNIQSMNPAAERMFGYETDELIDKNISCLMHNPYREEHDGYLHRYVSTETNHIIGELREVEGCCKDGSSIEIELQISDLKLDDHHIFIGLLRDISDRKKLAKERQTLQDHIEYSQRLESLGVLAGGVAHDFNNILSSIMGNASLAQTQIDEDSPLCDMLSQIETASQKAAELCQHMLAYAGKGRYVVKPCNLSKLVSGMQPLLRASIADNIKMRFCIADALPDVEADHNQMQQIVMNLVFNAAEAIDDAMGQIIIATGVRYIDAPEIASCLGMDGALPGTYVFLRISDTGGGIDPSIENKIFEPFFSTKFTGRGLGLSACLGIARSHAGLIVFHNQELKGVSFSVMLPFIRPAGNTVPQIAGKILIADDDPVTLRLSQSLCAKLGIDSITANDGDMAVELFTQYKDKVALVLLDLRMPNLGGIAALKQMRVIQPTLKAILMSSYDEAGGNTRMAASYNALFLPKPLSIEILTKFLLRSQ